MKPSQVKKDPAWLPLSREGRKTAEAHSPKLRPALNLRSQLERCQVTITRYKILRRNK
jgi:hypothetical protein